MVDDGSTDNTKEVAEDFARRDARIVVLNTSRAGVAGALNHGIRYSTAPYIARQDGDDASETERLQKQLAYLENYPECGVVGSWARIIDEAGIDIGKLKTPVEHEEILECLKVQNCIVHGSIMLRSELLRNSGVYAEGRRNVEDYDLWMRLIPLARFHMIPEYLYHYRVHSESITSVHSDIISGDTKQASDRFCQDIYSVQSAERWGNSFTLLTRSCAQSGWFLVLGRSLVKQVWKRPLHSVWILLATTMGMIHRLFIVMKARLNCDID